MEGQREAEAFVKVSNAARGHNFSVPVETEVGNWETRCSVCGQSVLFHPVGLMSMEMVGRKEMTCAEIIQLRRDMEKRDEVEA